MNPTIRRCAALGSLLLGGGLIFLGLTRLGWRRHGTSPWDPAFLHLDWLMNPELPYWGAHAANLGVLVVGCLALGAGLVLLRAGTR